MQRTIRIVVAVVMLLGMIAPWPPQSEARTPVSAGLAANDGNAALLSASVAIRPVPPLPQRQASIGPIATVVHRTTGAAAPVSRTTTARRTPVFRRKRPPDRAHRDTSDVPA